MLPYINVPFDYVGGKVGLGTDDLKLLFSFALSYPLAGVLKRIPDAKPEQKNIFIIGVAVFYLVGLFDLWTGIRTLVISSAGIYAIAAFIDGPLMPWIGFVFLMTHMSVNQLHRQFVGNPAIIDITGAQMVLVMKLSAFCWNVADGQMPEKELSDHQKERAIKKLPSILDYTGYVLFFPSLMIGPAFDYVDYRRWLDCTVFEVPTGVDPSKAPPTRKKRKIPRSGTPAMWKAGTGVFWALMFLVSSGYYYPDALLGDDYMSHSFLKRLWIMYAVNITTRMRYYTAWSLAEGACILSGMGYKGIDPSTGKISWDRLKAVDPWMVESAQNTRAYLGGWNIGTNNWLRNYIYLRVTPRGKKPGFQATMATFVTSALWHGFYPGYYLTFVLASFVQTVAKNCRRYFRPFFLDPVTQKGNSYKIYYDVASWLVTQVTFSFVTTPFLILTLPSSFLVWSRVYFYAILGTAGGIIFFSSPAKPYFKKQLQIRAEKAGVTGTDAKGKPTLSRMGSMDSLTGHDKDVAMGLPPDGIDHAVKEIRAEMEARQRKGIVRNDTM